MRKPFLVQRSFGIRAALFLAILTLAPVSYGGPVLTSADKVAMLARLQAQYRTEVQAHGFDSEEAKRLQAEIAALEKTPASNPGTDASTGSAAASSGTTGPGASNPPTGEHDVPGIAKVADYDPNQNVGNPCGAYAVTTILRSFGDTTPYQDVYNSIVPIKFGTSPHDIKTYLMNHGHDVVDRNDGSLDDVAAAVDRGERILMLLNVGGGMSGLHWAAVKGYKIVGGQRFWIFEDTYYGDDKLVSDADLAKAWAGPVPPGGVAGYNNYYMTVSKDAPGLGSRLLNAFYGLNGHSAGDVITSGLRDVTRGAADAFGSGRNLGQRIGGFFHMVGGGIFKVVGGVVGAIPTVIGNSLQGAGDAMMGWGADQWKNGSFFGKIAGAGATVLGAITKGVGWVLTGVGAIVSGILGAVGDAIGAVGDAIGSAINAIGSLF